MKKGIRHSAEFKARFARSQQALGEVIKEHRTKLGLNRTQFAAKAKISLGGLRRIETGHGNPNLTRLARLAKASGLTISRLFELIEEKQ